MPRFPLALALALALAGPALGACSTQAEPLPHRDCRSFLWARPDPGVDLRMVGSWNGWASPGLTLVPYGSEGWQVLPLLLPAGEYGYRLVQNGESALDPYAPLSAYQGEQEVSLLIVPSCETPAIQVDSIEVSQSGRASIKGTFLTARSGAALDPGSVRASEGDTAPRAATEASAEGRFTFSLEGLSRGKHTLLLEAADEQGLEAEPALASVWVEPAADSWADGVLYQIMIDRYRGDGGAPLSPPPTLGARAGGTLDGVRAEIEKGTFASLGVTALWLSPVYLNPIETRLGRDGHPSESYHGYWPVDDRAVDPRIGGESALEAVIAAAHAHGLRVILDIVPNHVYESNPRYLDHQGQGWFNEGESACVCGAPNCDWGAHMQTCWFAPYLPDVRWQRPEALSLAADDARFWMERFGADGARIDAVPMVPRAATRRIAHALRSSQAPRNALFSIGEVFTGPGAGGLDTIRYFLGPDGLDAAFDFPLMWSIRDAFGADRAGFDAVESTLLVKEKALAGSGSLLGLMIDNHDTSRFLSDAEGQGNVDPWSSAPPQPGEQSLYARQAMALALTFSLPGLPVLYYGDEIALAGASDPDNRRVMPAADTLSPAQQSVLATVQRMGALRRCFPALRTGARRSLTTAARHWAFVRDAGDGLPVLALFSKEAKPTIVPLPGAPPGDYLDAFTGAQVHLGEAAELNIDPLSFKILLPAQHPCP
ncbi:MAG: alpha-amylase family glycosyl hydrolase [Minicystis sp.]